MSDSIATVTKAGSQDTVWMAVALLLCLVSGWGASYIQTAGGDVEVTDLRWETPSGHTMSALLFNPTTATAATPAPAVVVSHGWFNNREMQDLNYVELSRRGYVTLSIDMYGHGHSDALPQSELLKRGIGMYDAVELIASLPYVDKTRIGVSGHSNGAMAANLSVVEDNQAAAPLIAAVLLVDRDPIYTRQGTREEYTNTYGSRHVGVIQAEYDEFFFRSRDIKGTVLTPPREYTTTPNAQSFLHFGANPGSFTSTRAARTVYEAEIDGRQATRAIYNLNQIHPWTHFSADAVLDLLNFFDRVFGAPTSIDPNSQVWQVRNVFTVLGLAGFGIFLVALPRMLVTLPAFAPHYQPAPPARPAAGGERVWFWVGLITLAIVSGVSYILLFGVANAIQPSWLPQGPPFFISLWAATNGLAALGIVSLSHLLYGRKHGISLTDIGVIPGWRKTRASVLIGLIVIVSAFALVFVVDYFFKTDFRVWVVTVRTFGPDKVAIALRYLPLLLIYFVANAVAINAFSRYTLMGREWLNTTLVVVFNVLAPVILIVAQYSTFFVTGDTLAWFPGITSIWLFPVVVFLAAAAIISRKLYRATTDPYLAGFIIAGVVTLISVSNTLTMG